MKKKILFATFALCAIVFFESGEVFDMVNNDSSGETFIVFETDELQSSVIPPRIPPTPRPKSTERT